MKNVKRQLSILLVFSMLITYVPAPVYAENTVEPVAETMVVETVVEEGTELATEQVDNAEVVTEATTEPEKEMDTATAAMEPEETEVVTEETTEPVVEAVIDESITTSEMAGNVFSEESFGAMAIDTTVVAQGTCGTNLTWMLDEEGTLTISGEGTMTAYSYSNQPWYSYRTQIKKVVVQLGVTSIGSHALYNCENVAVLEVPESVTSIGNGAFGSSEKLTVIFTKKEHPGQAGGYVGPSVCSDVKYYDITEDGFFYCVTNEDKVILSKYLGEAVDTLIIPSEIDGKSVTEIADTAYYRQTMREVVIPEGIKEVKQWTFNDCSQLTKVTMADTVETIGYYAFGACEKLQEVHLSNNLISLGENAFSGAGFAELELPDTLTTIGQDALSNTGLKRIDIPASVQSIAWRAFYNCSYLTMVVFEGGKPSSMGTCFGIGNGNGTKVKATVYYPANSSWTESNRGQYGGELTWIPYYCPEEHLYDGDLDVVCNICGDVRTMENVHSGMCGEQMTWVLDSDGTMYISGSGSMADYATKTDTPWYSVGSEILRIQVAEGVTDISDHAFEDCQALVSVLLPRTLTELGAAAFQGCTQLSEIIFIRTAPVFGDDVFAGVKATIYYPTNEEGWSVVIGEHFGGELLWEQYNQIVDSGSCGDLLSWVLKGDGTLTISGNGQMKEYSNFDVPHWKVYKDRITAVVIEEGVTTVSGYAFDGYKSLKSLELPNSLTSIGRWAFNYCTALTGELVIPDNVKTVGDSAFRHCGALTGLRLGAGLERIEDSAFTQCRALTGELKLPPDLTFIGERAFDDCLGFTGELILPEGLTSISDYAFHGLKGIAGTLLIPDNVTTIGDGAFRNIPKLTSVIFGKNVSTIGLTTSYYYDRPFYECAGITEVTFLGEVPPDIKVSLSMGYLDTVWVPKASLDAYTEVLPSKIPTTAIIKAIPGEDASGTCGENLTWTLSDAGTLTISGIGAMTNFKSYTVQPWASCRQEITSVVIEEGVTTIGDYAFYDCVKLKTVEAPDSLTNVGKYAFHNCVTLTGSPILPKGMTTIGERTYSGCQNLTSNLVIPSGVTAIGQFAFTGCKKLNGDLVFPDSLTRVDSYAFEGCAELDSVTLNNGLKSIDGLAFAGCAGLSGNLVIPNTVAGLGNETFRGCTGLTGLTLGTGLKSIGRDAFRGCTGLTGTLTIPDNIGSISFSAFKNTGFTEIIFGENVETLGSHTMTADTDAPFYGCSKVTRITFEGKIPPAIYGNSFTSMAQLQQIAVPAEGYAAYVEALKTYVDPTLITTDFASLKVSNLSAPQVYSKSAVLSWDALPVVKSYIISRGGVELARTEECTYIDRTMAVGQSYYYTVCGVLGTGEVTSAASYTVTTAAPVIVDLWTQASNNKLNREKNTISVQVKNSGNLQPLGENETVLELYYVNGEENVSAGKGSLKDDVYTVVWDTAELEDGEYTLIARLTDVDGTLAEYSEIVEIDNSRPSVLENIWAVANVTKIDLSWTRAIEADAVGYRIYRSTQRQGEFILLAEVEGLNTQTYSDTQVKTDGTYYYYVTTVTELEAESPMGQIVGATLTKDETPPTINKLIPKSGTYLTGKLLFSVDAEDNVQVTGARLYYLSDGDWVLLTDITSYNLTTLYDTAFLPNGPVRIKAVAYDQEGNESDGMAYDYIVDNEGPDRVVGLWAESTSVTVTLHWDDVQAEDVSYFLVERINDDGTVTRVNTVNSTLGINIYNLSPGAAYIYQVTAYDLRGNRGETSLPITVTTMADNTKPVISHLSPAAGYYADKIPLSITASDDYNVASIAVQVSQDRLNWTEKNVTNYNSDVYRERTLRYDLPLSEYPDGSSIYVRGIARDVSGNASDSGINAPYVQYIVDRTAPGKPENVEAIGYGGYIEIRWAQGTEADLNRYSVYRSESREGEFLCLSGSLRTLNYIDRTAQPDKIYYYKVQVNDKASNTSEYSDVVSAQVSPDNETPEILSIYPLDGAAVGDGNSTVSISAKDNSALASIHFTYSTDGVSYQTLEDVDLEADNADGYRGTKLPMDTMAHGQNIYIRVMVTDKAGNESKPWNVRYLIDLEGPVTTEGSAVYDSVNDQVKISWKGMDEADLYRYRIYRGEGETETLLGYITPESGKVDYVFLDQNLSREACTYTYWIEAVDNCGNAQRQNALQVELLDRSNPKAVLACDSTMNVGYEYIFDASGSTDNGHVVSYLWNFDDGHTSADAKAVHKYETVGIYTVHLTVTDDKGLTDTVYKTVHVVDAAATGTAVIYILDEAGNPVTNAPVYFDLGSDTQAIKHTGNKEDLDQFKDIKLDSAKKSGATVFQAAAGPHVVGCVIADNKWLPVKKEVTITAGQTTVITMTLVKQPIVEGSFEVNRMTFDEIKAAGINISAEESQHIVKLDVKLSYGTSQVIQTSFIYDVISNDVVPGGGSSSGGSFEIVDDNGVDRVLTPIVLNPNNTEAMTIAFLDMPVSASYLKEFFDVKLHIINNASSQFPMINNTVTLNIPDGLTLVEGTETESSATVTIPEIGGQTTKTVAWILRGDVSGEYDISANFVGTLGGFNENIEAGFKAPEKLKVYGLDTLKLVVEIDPSVNYGAHYFNLSLENDSPIDVYLPSVDIVGNVLDSYLIRINKAAEEKEDTSLNHKMPELTHLSTILENSLGAKTTLSPDEELMSLAPGEKMTKRYAVYNVIDYDYRLLIDGALAELTQSLGIRWQLILSEMDLYGTDNALTKLQSLSGDKKAMYDYIMDGSQFLYVRESTHRKDEILDSITARQFADARAEMALSQADPETVKDITRKLVGQMMVDEALGEAINGAVHDKYSQYVDALIKVLQHYLEENPPVSSHQHLFFQMHQGEEKLMKNVAKALQNGGLDDMMNLLITQLKALGMTDDEGQVLMEYAATAEFDQAQQQALKQLCSSHSTLVTDLTGSFDGWQRYAELLQTFLGITAAYEQTMDLLDMLLSSESLDVNIRTELENLKNQLVYINRELIADYENKVKGNGNGNGNGNNKEEDPSKDEVQQDLTEIFSNSPSKAFTQLMFGTLLDQLSYWNITDDSQLVLQVHTELSFAVTELLSGMMDDNFSDNESAVRPLALLKYLIQLRLLGEQTFTFFGSMLDADQQHNVTEWVFNLTGGLFPDASEFSLDDYANYVLTLLQEYRDSIFITNREPQNIPDAPTVSIDFRNKTTKETFDNTYEYSYNGTKWVTGTGKPIKLSPGIVNTHIWIRKKSTAESFAGNTTKLTIPAVPRVQGDVTILFDKNQYIITGLLPGSYRYALTNDQNETNLDAVFIQDTSRVYRISDKTGYIWLAIQAEATDSSFVSQIRYVATEAPAINWALEKGYITQLELDTQREILLLQLEKQGYPDATITPNPNNHTDKIATGDKIQLEKGGETHESVVVGDVNGDAAIDEDDLNDLIQDVGADDKLEGVYKEAGDVSGDDNGDDDFEIDIDDIVDEKKKIKKDKDKDKNQ